MNCEDGADLGVVEDITVSTQNEISCLMDDEINITDSLLEVIPSISKHPCCDCRKNSTFINSLMERLENLERKFTASNSPSFDETQLLSELRQIKEERDSLLTTIRLLMKDVRSTVVDEKSTESSKAENVNESLKNGGRHEAKAKGSSSANQCEGHRYEKSNNPRKDVADVNAMDSTSNGQRDG